jgi:formate hydrogenlyase subunit 3/multisubunit Na+/H+ antiporter MnhD subunit
MQSFLSGRAQPVRLWLRLLDALALTLVGTAVGLFLRAGRSLNDLAIEWNGAPPGTNWGARMGHYVAQCRLSAALVAVAVGVACVAWWGQRAGTRYRYLFPRR